MTTDTSEKGLESLIMRQMTGTEGLAVAPNQVAEQRPASWAGTGYTAGSAQDYDRAHALDVPQLFAFLRATQPEAFKKLAMVDANDPKDIHRLKFLARLSGEIGKRGVIDVLRKGVAHGPLHFDLFYGTPSPGNAKAERLHAENRFSITRQLAYSTDETRRALDLCLFINGLPIATFELKNSLTKQTVEDAVQQYKRDRDPRERLFEFGRCVVHFAVDDSEVRMCTELRGKGSWFLAFNKGYNDGAGNPPNPHGLKTDYLWKEILTPAGLTDILENYAEIEPVPTDAGGRKREPELDRLSNILKAFNEQFGTLFTDTDRVAQRIRDDIAPKVAADAAYQNAKENTPHTARMAHDHALAKVMQHLLKDDTQVYKQFVENESFKRFVGDMVYAITNA